MLDDGSVCPDGQGEALRRAFWFHIRSAWNDPGAASAGTFTLPGQPEVWYRQDPYFRSDYDTLARDDEKRVVEAVRSQALEGHSWALKLCYRASRGMARQVDADPRNKYTPAEPMAPHVAAAMIRAGLKAAGKECFDDRLPEWKPAP
jgi:hypothetical protein